MPDPVFDALIIGGGPGGSSAATYLARAGRRTLLLEKEHFPRFHVGESLLPYNHRLFEELGVLPALEAAGFTRKFGAQFHMGNSSQSLKLTFSDGCYTRSTMAFQVERAKFDHILLNHARSCGADVREGWTVARYSTEKGGVAVEARNQNGLTQTFRGAFLIDASGRANLTGNQENLRVVHPHLKKVAIFGHFHGVATDQGSKAGDIHVVRLKEKWFWLIPVSPVKVSVGCVMDQAEFASSKLAPAELFNRAWQSSTEMRRRMKLAVPTGPLQTTSDFSYYNRRLVGPRVLRVGDAAGFMDPVFSAGVYLAMYSGNLASRAIIDSLEAGDEGGVRLRRYEKRIFRAMKFYWEMVGVFYTQPFIELFMQPRGRYQLPDAIVAILAGELEGGWKIEWRKRLFFLLVRLQKYWPLVPRLSFAEPELPAQAESPGSSFEALGAPPAADSP